MYTMGSAVAHALTTMAVPALASSVARAKEFVNTTCKQQLSKKQQWPADRPRQVIETKIILVIDCPSQIELIYV